MIQDNIKNASSYYYLGERFEKGFEYLQRTDILELKNGRYEIDGTDVFVNIQDYQTKSLEDGRFEAHKKYADIQYIVKGSEKMGYGLMKDFKPVTFYDETNDIMFLEGSGEFIHANSGDFIIFMPQEAHMPCISVQESSYVKKAVVKVKI